MKTFLTSVFFSVSAMVAILPASAQWTCTIGPAPTGMLGPDLAPDAQPMNEGQKAYQALCPSGGCGMFVIRKNPGIPNAAMQVVGMGQGMLRYNDQFMQQQLMYYGPGATQGIIAHECGHLIDATRTGPSWGMKPPYDKELQADYFAGVALARLGASDYEIKNSLRVISAYPTADHPAWQDRWNALDSGFRDGGGAGLPAINPNE